MPAFSSSALDRVLVRVVPDLAPQEVVGGVRAHVLEAGVSWAPDVLPPGDADGAARGLDVFDVEPLPEGHALTRLENVVLTPHSAGVTPEALEAGLQLAIENVSNFLNGRPRHVVIAP